MAKAQLEIRNPALDRAHPHFKGFRYASLGSHLDAIREPLARHGLMLTQTVGSENRYVTVTTVLAHTSGEWISSSVGMELAGNAKAQDLGAIVTYLRRYSIAAMALLTGDDDTDADEDRILRDEPKRPTAQSQNRDVFDPTPAKGKKAATAPAAAPANPSKPAHKWLPMGTDVVRVDRIVERGSDLYALLCQHATAGAAWVQANAEWAGKCTEGRNINLRWSQNPQGILIAQEVDDPPTFRNAAGELEIPY
jgi:hypothetical protein